MNIFFCWHFVYLTRYRQGGCLKTIVFQAIKEMVGRTIMSTAKLRNILKDEKPEASLKQCLNYPRGTPRRNLCFSPPIKLAQMTVRSLGEKKSNMYIRISHYVYIYIFFFYLETIVLSIFPNVFFLSSSIHTHRFDSISLIFFFYPFVIIFLFLCTYNRL